MISDRDALKTNKKNLPELNDFNDAFINNRTINKLFEEQVEKTPDNIAVVDEEKELTFLELNKRANKLASYLKTKNVKAGIIVGVYINRSLDMIIGILAILKAGGTYVPLDSSYPKKRLKFIIEDTKLSIIVTNKLFDNEDFSFQSQVININDNHVLISKLNSENILSSSLFNDLMCVIYTSGSTGTPKGVILQHSNFINRFMWVWKHYPYQKNDVCCFRSSLNVVISVSEIFSPLLQGIKLIIMPEKYQQDLEQLIQYLKKYEITHINFIPSFLKIFLQQYPFIQDDLPKLRHVEVGGEAIQYDLVQNFFKIFNKARLINRYGSTEVHSILWFEFLPHHERYLYAPIGSQISNTQIYILDNNLQPLPPDTIGELYVGGQALARGYLNRPQIMDVVFLDNPFDNNSLPLYKTGDLVRARKDGIIEYIGRADRQIQIRGFRIEIAEIEIILCQQEFINEAVIVPNKDNQNRDFLIAFLVPNIIMLEKSITDEYTSKLRQILRTSLPEYMVPNFFIYIEKIPLTFVGKIDFVALLDLFNQYDTEEEVYVLPTNIIEKQLADIWGKLLDHDKVSIQSNFFKVGGDSLLASQLISRIRRVYNIDITFQTFFECPTIAELAVEINKNFDNTLPKSLFNIQKYSYIDNKAPLSFSQQRLWFLDLLLSNKSTYNISIGFKLYGKLDIKALLFAFNYLFNRHDILRTNFIELEDKGTQIIAHDISFNLSQIDLAHLNKNQKEQEISNLAKDEASTPFNLAKDILLRSKLIKLSNNEYVLLITMHHIISDGWSVGILLKELSNLYNTYINKQEINLPLLPINYIDYAVWQRQRLQGELLNEQLFYWKEQLSEIPSCLNLPTHKVRPIINSYRGSKYSFNLNKEISYQLKSLGNSVNATYFMVLLALLKTLLYRYTGQESILIGAPVAGRNLPEIENIIGFFVNTVVLRSKINDRLSFIELLHQVRDTTINAFKYQDLPFEQIVDHLKVDRTLNYHPLFQVALVLQNTPISVLDFNNRLLSKLNY